MSNDTNNHHRWSPSSAKMSTEAQTKKFDKSESVISTFNKALKFYPAESEQVLEKGCYAAWFEVQHCFCSFIMQGSVLQTNRARPSVVRSQDIASYVFACQ